MPKRPADDVDTSLMKSVRLKTTPSTSSLSHVTPPRLVGRTLPGVATSSTNVHPSALVNVASVSPRCTAASLSARTVEPIAELVAPVKLCKADVKQWLSAAGETFDDTSSSVELKTKLDNFFDNNITAPLGLIATMPPCVLTKFVKYIFFHLAQSGVLTNATPASIAIKEEAIWRLIDQVKVLHNMNMSLDAIVGQLGGRRSAESESRPCS
jgi:hypothetical protein